MSVSAKPGAPATPPPVEAAGTAPPMRPNPVALGVGILSVIAIVAALYLARAFFVPLLLGILASYALQPLVSVLAAWHIPRAAGAALVLATLIAGLGWAIFSIGDDATAIIETLPAAAHKVRLQLSDARNRGPTTTLQKIQAVATELQGAATDAATMNTAKTATPKPTLREAETGAWLRDYMLAQSALLFTVLAQTPIVLLLTYFLLASGEHFRRKLVHLVGPTLSRQKEAVRLLDEIDSQIQRYLLTTLGANVLVALGTWLAFKLMAVEHPGAWGIGAGILHFIPYLGPVAFALTSGMAAFLQFGTAQDAFIVAAVSLLVSGVVGSVIVTWLQSRLARMNAAVLFIALLFFGWLWGLWGLLLGAPLVAIAKVICDRVEPLKPAGDLLGQ